MHGDAVTKVLQDRKETTNPAVSLSNWFAHGSHNFHFRFILAPITTSEVPLEGQNDVYKHLNSRVNIFAKIRTK